MVFLSPGITGFMVANASPVRANLRFKNSAGMELPAEKKIYKQGLLVNKSSNGTIMSGRYEVDVNFQDSVVKKIKFKNIKLDRDELLFSIDELENHDYAQIYNIDPKDLDFDLAEVTVNAKGRMLYKCVDYVDGACLSDWLFIMDLTPGMDYTFTLIPEDPTYVELQTPVSCTKYSGGKDAACADVANMQTADSNYEEASTASGTVAWILSNHTNSDLIPAAATSINCSYICVIWWKETTTIDTNCQVDFSVDMGANFDTVWSSADCSGLGTSDPGDTVPDNCVGGWINVTTYVDTIAKAEKVAVKMSGTKSGAAGGSKDVRVDYVVFNVSFESAAVTVDISLTNTPILFCPTGIGNVQADDGGATYDCSGGTSSEPDGYPLVVSVESGTTVNVDLWIKGSGDLVNNSDSVLLANLTFDNSTSGTPTNTTTDYQIVYKNSGHPSTNNIYWWMFIPGGAKALTYENTITIKANETSA